jgi:hypothetical protein
MALLPRAVFGELLLAVFLIPFPAVLPRPFFVCGVLPTVSPVSLDQERLVALEIGSLISFFCIKSTLMFPVGAAFGRCLDASPARQADAFVAVSFTPVGCFGF